MWKDFGIKCVNWNTFCILDEYPRAGVDALKHKNYCKKNKKKTYITFSLGLDILGTISVLFSKSWALCLPFINVIYNRKL